jgi:hypothetical protein
VRLASRGLRDMDEGVEVISDSTELQTVRQQARRIYLKSALTAAILTAIALIP